MVDETRLMVWIDQDLCTGDGICEEIVPDVFVGRDDGLWVVKEEAAHFGATIVFDAEAGEGHGDPKVDGVLPGCPTIRSISWSMPPRNAPASAS